MGRSRCALNVVFARKMRLHEFARIASASQLVLRLRAQM
jgi:hypothetical protein